LAEGKLQIVSAGVLQTLQFFERGAPAQLRESSGAHLKAGYRLDVRVPSPDRQQVNAGARASPSWSGGRRRPNRTDELPVIVQDRVPELREFQFLVADEQIVIVDPHDRSIVLVIDRA
jgi:hypothetical protein